MPDREIIPYPMEFEASAGYIVVLVNRSEDGQSLLMRYMTARAPLQGKNSVELEQEDKMMERLTNLARKMSFEFNG